MLRRIGGALERGVDAALRRPGRPPVLDPYIGYATPEGYVLRARVLSALRRTTPDPGASRLANLRQMAGLFLTDEVEGVTVAAGGRTTQSDAEGYVRLLVPATGRAPWAEVEMAIPGQPGSVPCPVRVAGPEAERLVISDIDDTVIDTGAHSLARNLWTTFTGSHHSRVVHADAAALLTQAGAGERNPVVYVSSSPWNLHAFLQRLLARDGVPRGPMFLRDYGLTGMGGGHLGHKGAAIDAVLAAMPDLPVYLVGDTGQKDAAVFVAAIERHGPAARGGRIAGVALREPAPGLGDDDAAALEAVTAAGVPCHHGAELTGAATLWGWS